MNSVSERFLTDDERSDERAAVPSSPEKRRRRRIALGAAAATAVVVVAAVVTVTVLLTRKDNGGGSDGSDSGSDPSTGSILQRQFEEGTRYVYTSASEYSITNADPEDVESLAASRESTSGVTTTFSVFCDDDGRRADGSFDVVLEILRIQRKVEGGPLEDIVPPQEAEQLSPWQFHVSALGEVTHLMGPVATDLSFVNLVRGLVYHVSPKLSRAAYQEESVEEETFSTEPLAISLFAQKEETFARVRAAGLRAEEDEVEPNGHVHPHRVARWYNGGQNVVLQEAYDRSDFDDWSGKVDPEAMHVLDVTDVDAQTGVLNYMAFSEEFTVRSIDKRRTSTQAQEEKEEGAAPDVLPYVSVRSSSTATLVRTEKLLPQERDEIRAMIARTTYAQYDTAVEEEESSGSESEQPIFAPETEEEEFLYGVGRDGSRQRKDLERVPVRVADGKDLLQDFTGNMIEYAVEVGMASKVGGTVAKGLGKSAGVAFSVLTFMVEDYFFWKEYNRVCSRCDDFTMPYTRAQVQPARTLGCLASMLPRRDWDYDNPFVRSCCNFATLCMSTCDNPGRDFCNGLFESCMSQVGYQWAIEKRYASGASCQEYQQVANRFCGGCRPARTDTRVVVHSDIRTEDFDGNGIPEVVITSFGTETQPIDGSLRPMNVKQSGAGAVDHDEQVREDGRGSKDPPRTTRVETQGGADGNMNMNLFSACVPTPVGIMLCFDFNVFASYGVSSGAEGLGVSVAPYFRMGADVMASVSILVARAGVYASGTLLDTRLPFTVAYKPESQKVCMDWTGTLSPFTYEQGIFYQTQECGFHWCCYVKCNWSGRHPIGTPSRTSFGSSSTTFLRTC